MNSDDIAEAWRRGRHARTKTMSTDGIDLYSYGLRIGYTAENGDNVAIDFSNAGGRFVSMTTSKHVSYAKHYAFRTVRPPKV